MTLRIPLSLWIAATLVFAAIPSFAQSLPYAWPQTVGTTSLQVLPSNSARKQIVFHNPSTTATVWICPTVSRKDGTPIVCAANGAGALTLVPGQTWVIGGYGSNAIVPTPWNAIASAPGSPFTILEFE